MDKLKNINGIFFDLGGTLIYPTSGSWMFSDLAYRYFPKEVLATPQAQAALAEAGRVLHSNHLLHTMEEEYARFLKYYTDLAQALSLPLSSEDLRLVTEDKLRKEDNYRIFDDSIPTLRALHGKYKLGIISDTWPSIVPVLKSFGILDYMDCATYSYEVGTLKPNPKMYADALTKMGLPAGETVFIDDLAKNLDAARTAGIHPVLVRAMPGVEAREDMRNISKISGLLDLLD